MKKNIIIIEDNSKIREGFTAIIDSTEKYMVSGSYSNCEDAIKNLGKDKPDVALMDIDLPGMNGIEGTLKIKKQRPGCIILTIKRITGKRIKYGCLLIVIIAKTIHLSQLHIILKVIPRSSQLNLRFRLVETLSLTL